MDSVELAIALVKEVGYERGLFAVFFLLAHRWIFKMYKDRLDDRQNEINRMAEENREYREYFMQFIGKAEQTKQKTTQEEAGR